MYQKLLRDGGIQDIEANETLNDKIANPSIVVTYSLFHRICKKPFLVTNKSDFSPVGKSAW